jgi:hypothetical protein
MTIRYPHMLLSLFFVGKRMTFKSSLYVESYCRFTKLGNRTKSLKIPKGESESVIRRTDNIMAKRKKLFIDEYNLP